MVSINEIMNFAAYVDIRANNPTAFVNKIGLWKFIFQQDNDDKHTSKLSKVNFEEKDIELLLLPPQSPDLNPIETLWALIRGS